MRYYAALRRVADFLQKNISTKISIEKGAQVAALSRSAFEVRFKTAAGQPFHSFLILRGIARAIRALEGSDESITVVVERAGFESVDSLVYNFKHLIGCTPSEYRAIFLNSRNSTAVN